MKQRTLPLVYTERQMADLVRAPRLHTPTGVRDRAILAVLCSTGVRASELCQLNVADLQGSLVFVRKGKFGDQRFVAMTSLQCPPELSLSPLFLSRSYFPPTLPHPVSGDNCIHSRAVPGRAASRHVPLRVELAGDLSAIAPCIDKSLHQRERFGARFLGRPTLRARNDQFGDGSGRPEKLDPHASFRYIDRAQGDFLDHHPEKILPICVGG